MMSIKNTKTKELSAEALLLTEEEYDKKRREKAKENINRFLRIAGLVASIFLIYIMCDFFFEISWFGAIFTRTEYNNFWNVLSDALSGNIGVSNGQVIPDGLVDKIMGMGSFSQSDAEGVSRFICNVISSMNPFDNYLNGMHLYNFFFPQLAITLILISVLVGVVYLVTYNVIDLITFAKSIYAGAKGISKDITGNIKDTVEIITEEKPKKKKTKKLDLDNISTEEKTVEKKKKEKKKKEEATVFEYSEEALNALLNGETLPSKIESEEESKEPEEKKLDLDL